MSRVFRELCSELWAITPDWLHVLAALAVRDSSHPSVVNAHSRDGEKVTPVDRFNALLFVASSPRPLEGQGSGRAVVADRVAIVPVLGPIFPRSNMMTAMSGATSCAAVQRDLSAALNDEGVDSILLAVDSPGGAVSGVSALADSIYASRKKKPISAHVSGTGASAAYWLATAAERVSLDRTALVGSIGVVSAVPKQVNPDRDGYSYIEVVSSNAPNKRPDVMTPEGFGEIRRNLDAIENHFVSDVARGRGVTREKVLADFGQGGCFVGAEAVGQGMADGVESFDAAFRRMARVGKASRARQAAGG